AHVQAAVAGLAHGCSPVVHTDRRRGRSRGVPRALYGGIRREHRLRVRDGVRMVKQVVIALMLLTSNATADDDDNAFNMFGFRMSMGALPIDHSNTQILGIGLGVEHPVFHKTRVFADYEWLWLQHRGPLAAVAT